MSEREPHRGWERDWRAFEENHMGRPRLPVEAFDENEDRLRQLHWKVLSFLGLGQAARKEGVTETQRESFYMLQAKAFWELDAEQEMALIKYLVWKQQTIASHSMPVSPSEPLGSTNRE